MYIDLLPIIFNENHFVPVTCDTTIIILVMLCVLAVLVIIHISAVVV